MFESVLGKCQGCEAMELADILRSGKILSLVNLKRFRFDQDFQLHQTLEIEKKKNIFWERFYTQTNGTLAI